jgi:hypothetical protein
VCGCGFFVNGTRLIAGICMACSGEGHGSRRLMQRVSGEVASTSALGCASWKATRKRRTWMAQPPGAVPVLVHRAGDPLHEASL